VFDTLKLIIKLVFEKAKTGGTSPRPPVDAGVVRQPVREPVPVAAPYPSPVDVTAPPAPVAAAPVSSLAATLVQAPPQSAPAPVHRPYPGSETGQGHERTAVPIGLAKAGRQPAAHESGRIAVAAADAPVESTVEQESSITPQMAPSLRRRAEVRKRGFFKRMFGIK
jgi:hypothetical protein